MDRKHEPFISIQGVGTSPDCQHSPTLPPPPETPARESLMDRLGRTAKGVDKPV
jgi:hypothetical protein